MLRRLRQAFQGRICWFRGIAGNNRILFAVKGGGVDVAGAGHAAESGAHRTAWPCPCSTAAGALDRAENALGLRPPQAWLFSTKSVSGTCFVTH
jgi:hypothetical protein